MATIKRFEDMEVWKLARKLSKEIYDISMESELANNFRFRDQIRKSSGSIMDNIAEGFERDGKKEFVQFLSIAKGSSGECRSQLYRCMDQNYIDKNKFNELFNQSEKISKQIAGLIKYLKKSEIRGIKYK